MLENKTILVSGAAGLLGSHVVKGLVLAGANVIATDINIDKMNEGWLSFADPQQAQRITCKSLDITNESAVKAFFEQQPVLDGAVNCSYPRNASYGNDFLDVTLESFNDNVSLHLGSTFLFCQQCVAYFKRHSSPFSLVNIASIYGVVAPKFEIYQQTDMTMPVEYAAIKSAIIHLNAYVSNYVSDSRFRVNSISPGGIFDHQNETFLQEYKQKTHGKGMLDPEDVVPTIQFLLSDQSKFITGRNIVIDDGFSL